MNLQITDWILSSVRLTALFSIGTAQILLITTFPAKFNVRGFIQFSGRAGKFAIV